MIYCLFLGYKDINEFNNLDKIKRKLHYIERRRSYKPITFGRKLIKSLNNIISDLGDDNPSVVFYKKFCDLTRFNDRMKLICDEQVDQEVLDNLFKYLPESSPFEKYYNCLGPSVCKALKYQNSLLKNEYERRYSNQKIEIDSLIFNNFKVGGKYPLADIKEILANIFNSVGYNEVPKATILKNYFEVRPIKMTLKVDDRTVKVNGFELLSKKD